MCFYLSNQLKRKTIDGEKTVADWSAVVFFE